MNMDTVYTPEEFDVYERAFTDGWRILFNADHRIRDGVPAERWYYLSHDLEIERDPEGALYAAHPELQPPTWDDESHLWIDYKGDPVDPQPDPPSYSMYWDEATQTWYWYSDNTPVDPQPDPPETETP